MSSSAVGTDLFQGLPCLQLVFFKSVIACPVMHFDCSSTQDEDSQREGPARY